MAVTSTLLEALTASKPKIAAHAFTTLNPQVGVCRIRADGALLSSPFFSPSSSPSPSALASSSSSPSSTLSTSPPSTTEGITPILESTSVPTRDPLPDSTRLARARTPTHDEALRFTLCDNPGLAPLAHLNRGLGHHFLLSLSRAPLLLLVLDFSRPWEGAGGMREEAEGVWAEVGEWEDGELRGRVGGVVGCKSEMVVQGGDGGGEEKRRLLEAWVEERIVGPRRRQAAAAGAGGEVEAVPVWLVSAKWGWGVRELAWALGERVVALRARTEDERRSRREERRREEEDRILGLQRKQPPVLRIAAPQFGLRREEEAAAAGGDGAALSSGTDGR